MQSNLNRSRKMAAPKPLPVDRRKFHCTESSEPSVRRARFHQQTDRPFGANGGTTTVVPAVENFVPRTSVFAPTAGKLNRSRRRSSNRLPTSCRAKKFGAIFEDQLSKVLSAPMTEVAEFSSVGEPTVIEESTQVVESVEEFRPLRRGTGHGGNTGLE